MEKARKLGVFLGVLVLCNVGVADGLVGKRAPEITVRVWITKNSPDITNLAGRVYVAEFWATWCHPCVETISHLNALNNKYKDRGLEIIALSQDKSAEKVRRFVHKKGINYHVAIDNGTADWFGIRGYPTVVVVNHKGKVIWQGYPWDPQFERVVAGAVAIAPPPLLAGVDLGPFRDLKEPLCGGREFAKAYRKIESRINSKSARQTAKIAKRIVGTIDQRIAQKISEADRLRDVNPVEAYRIYADIVAKYDGIKVVERVRAVMIELERSEKLERHLFATENAARVIE